MGGRGSGSGGVGLGGGNSGPEVNVQSERGLISERERSQQEVDDTLSVLRDVNERYGYTIYDATVADIGASPVIAYYTRGTDSISVNQDYFDSVKMNEAYDRCVQSGFHPPRGNKTGTQAVVSHELGHALTDEAARRSGMTFDQVAERIVGEAFGVKKSSTAKAKAGKISGYAAQSNAECIAEAFADVYCNGRNAKTESRSVVRRLDHYMGR